jgi:hypothetical protein
MKLLVDTRQFASLAANRQWWIHLRSRQIPRSCPMNRCPARNATLTMKSGAVYYMPDPYFVTTELSRSTYLQPAWLFRGHYSDGSEFEYLIQALKEEFLLPELAPYTQPG